MPLSARFSGGPDRMTKQRTLFHLVAFFVALSFVVLGAARAKAQAVPSIERIEPTSGPPGTQVTVVGRSFDAQTTVTLSGTACEIVGRTPNRWQVRIPAGAVTGPIVVRNATGPSTANPTFRVTTAAPPPVIERIEPTTGAPGSEVTIHGHDFSSRITDNVVTLGSRQVVVRSATPFELRVTVPDGAETGAFAVRVGASTAASPDPFTIAVGTRITDFQPRLGPPGTHVTITGTGYSTTTRDDRVTINNVTARVEHAAATELVVTIPNNAANGPLVVDVRNGGRVETTTPFVIQLPPTVTAVEPSAAPAGTRVVLRGTHFGTDLRIVTVKLGDRPATIRDIADGQLTVEVPAGTPAGAARFGVTVATLGPAQAPADFTVLTPLAIADYQPRLGPPGTRVTITGTGFSPTPAEDVVSIGAGHCEVTAASPISLTVTIPAGGSGVLDVAVTHNGHARTTGAFVVTHPPFIASFEPVHVQTGDTVTLHGTGFGAQASLLEVAIGGHRLELVSVADTLVTARVPASVSTGRLVATVRLQGSATAQSDLEIVSPLSVEAYAPHDGFPGSVVTLRGTGFFEGTQVVFNGAPAPSPATIVSAAQLRTIVPTGATTGALAVRTPDGRTAAAGDFTIVAPPAGVGVTQIDASCTHPGCTVVLHGYGFDRRLGQNHVMFGGMPARVRAVTPDSLTIQLPAHPGTGLFELTAHGANASSEPFTLTPE